MHHRITFSSYVFATKACIDNLKKKFSTARSPQHVLRIWQTSAHQRLRSFWEFGAPQQISTGFVSCLRYCSDIAHRRPTNLCTMYSRLLGWYSGAPAPDGILPGENFTLPPSLAFYIDSVTARHSSSGCQPNFAAWHNEWNCSTLEKSPPIFGWAAIRLGIGPHSNF